MRDNGARMNGQAEGGDWVIVTGSEPLARHGDMALIVYQSFPGDRENEAIATWDDGHGWVLSRRETARGICVSAVDHCGVLRYLPRPLRNLPAEYFARMKGGGA